jgi:1,4-dihydroxy-2-naphthoate octaprenyltransferase
VIGQTVRVGNWLDSKIPPLLGTAYVLILVLGMPAERALHLLVALIVSSMSLAGYAHVLNDIFDIGSDQLAGKVNRVARMSPWQRAALLAGLAGMGAVPWLWVPLTPMAGVALAAIYILPVVYSIPPLRLKERGILGVLADAFLAHACPILFVVALFANPTAEHAPVPLSVAIVAAVWATCVGLRGILLHQIWDREHDVRSGIHTFVVRAGSGRARAIILRHLFPAEIATFAVLAIVVGFNAPLLVAGVMLVAGLDLVEQTFEWAPTFDPAPDRPGVNTPPHDLYEVWFPALALVLLAARDAWFVPALIIHAVLFRAGLETRGRELALVIRLLPGRSCAALWRVGYACWRWAWK